MRSVFLLALSILTASLTLAQDGGLTDPAELTALRTSWSDGQTQRLLVAVQRRDQAKAAYLTGLTALEKPLLQKGDLDALLLLRAERDRVQAGQETTSELRRGMLADLRAWRDRYDVSLRAISAEATKAEQAAQAKYAQDLQALQIVLTKKGQVDQALAVKVEREKLIAAPPAPVQPAASAEPDSRLAAQIKSIPGSSTMFGVPPEPGKASPSAATPPTGAAPTDPIAEKISSGSWRVVDKPNSVFGFQRNGKVRVSWKGGGGTWKITGPLNVEFTFISGDNTHFGQLSPDLQTMTYQSRDGNMTARFETP